MNARPPIAAHMQAETATEGEAAAARTARHLAMLRELAELAMALARDAAGRALADGGALPDGADIGLTFARLSRAVRQTIALEARIAAGEPGPAASRAPSMRDPRLSGARRVLRAAAGMEALAADRNELLREIDERLDELPTLDPDGTLSAETIINEISHELGLDLSRLPDSVLFAAEPRGRWSVVGMQAARDAEPAPPDPPEFRPPQRHDPP